MRRLGDDSAVAVGLGQTTVTALVHVLPVVAHLQGDGFRHQLLFREPEHQDFCHLPDDEFCFIIAGKEQVSTCPSLMLLVLGL